MDTARPDRQPAGPAGRRRAPPGPRPQAHSSGQSARPASLTRPARRTTRHPGRCARPSPPPGPPSTPRPRPHPPSWTTPAPVPGHRHRAGNPARRPAKTGQTGTPAPRPRAEPRPAAPPRRPPRPLTARTSCPARQQPARPAGPPPQHDAPARAAASAGPRPAAHRNRRLRRSRPAPRPLTDDDICLGLSRLPAFVFADLLSVIDTASPWTRRCRQLAPYSGERAAGEPDPGARETVTAEPAGVRIQVDAADGTRTGLITWPEIDDQLGPGLTPARRQIVVQATQIRLRFAMANASFRAIGEGRLAAGAEHELRGLPRRPSPPC